MKAFTVYLALIVATVASVPYNQCPPEQEDDWTIEKLLRHEDCDKFYKCTFGQPVAMRCPAGLWFCLDNMRCEWAHMVDCRDRNVPGQSTTTTTTQTTTRATPTTTTTTPTTTTTRTTTTTTTPRPTTTTTTPTTTTTRTTTTTPTTTTTTATTTTRAPGFRTNGCPVDLFTHWLLPHETNCNFFYYCVWGERVLRNCPATLHFNRRIQVCDWPASAGCV